jgi:hypothetical protein
VTAGGPDRVKTAYQQWADNAVRYLGTLLSIRDLDRLITTPRHQLIYTVPPSGTDGTAGLVNLEFEETAREIGAVLDELRAWQTLWAARPGVIVVPDTNVLVHHPKDFDAIDWASETRSGNDAVRLVLPMAVIDELDNAKRGKADVRSRARVTARRVGELFSDTSRSVTLVPPGDLRGGVYVDLLLDATDHQRLDHGDSELVDRMCCLRDLTGRDVTVLTYDNGMDFRARTAGLKVLRPVLDEPAD